MKLYIHQKPATCTLTCCLLACMLLTVSCRKEKIPDPSNLDKNYFVIEDNPNDPIDHSIYEFYKKTGIAVFYNDSIYKMRVSKENETPARYTYIKLSLNYAPLGASNIYFEPLKLRTNIQPLLQLLETDMIPKLPSASSIPSLYLIDSFSLSTIRSIQLSHGLTAIYGFNTVGIKVEDIETMNNEERKMYAASILAGIAVKKLTDLYAARLQKDFFSISRAAAITFVPQDIYSGYLWLLLVAPGTEPVPQDIGLLFYPIFNSTFGDFFTMPLEADDIRAFLTAAFYYTTQEFTNLHPNETLVLKKFGIIRNIVREAGFKIPD
jgi:hypothetical protein